MRDDDHKVIAMPKPGVMIYYSILPALETLTMDERGQLLTAILRYGNEEIPINFDGSLNVAWAFIKPMLDKDTSHYDKVCEGRRKAANARWDEYRSANDANASNCMQTHAFDANCNSNPNINSMQHANSVSKEKLMIFSKKHSIPESFVNSLYERYAASDWTDQNGKPILNIKKFLLRAWEDEKSKAEPEDINLMDAIRERQRADREKSCTPDKLVEYPPGSGRYRPKAEIEVI